MFTVHQGLIRLFYIVENTFDQRVLHIDSSRQVSGLMSAVKTTCRRDSSIARPEDGATISAIYRISHSLWLGD